MDFFKLNERLQLHRERAGMISLLGSALKFVEAGIDQVDNKRVIARLEGSRIPHAACLRAFRHLWRSDARSAKKDS